MNFWTARRGGPPRCAITGGGPRSPIPETDGMTMDSIFHQPGDIGPLPLPALLPASTAPAAPSPEISRLDRISRLAALGPEGTVAGLLWLR